MSVTVIGIGNPVMQDDAVGLAILRRLQGKGADELAWVPERRQQPVLPSGEVADTIFIDGGTSGMELLPIVQDADKLIILDALAGPGEPGTVVQLVGDQIPRLMNSKLSPHQVGLLDLLSAARLLGREPNQVAVVGVVAGGTDLRVGMSPEVLAAIDEATEKAQQLIDQWSDSTST